MREFSIRTNVFFGENALGRLEEIQGKSVLIVSDRFMVESGVVDKIKARLNACHVFVFSDIIPDPPIEVVAEGIKCLAQCKAEVMIAVGGGSPPPAAQARK